MWLHICNLLREFTGIFVWENGGGSSTNVRRGKACWDLHGMYTSSRHIPCVRWPGMVQLCKVTTHQDCQNRPLIEDV
jgi:Acetamidase/Formamidase family